MRITRSYYRGEVLSSAIAGRVVPIGVEPENLAVIRQELLEVLVLPVFFLTFTITFG